MDFLQKPLAWFPNFYLCVQSKNSGRNNFFLFFFSYFFRILNGNFFRLLAKKLQEVFKTTFDVSRGTLCGLNFFFLIFESFWIFWRNLWHGSQNSIYVVRVKIEEELIFLFSFSEFFRNLSERFSDFRPKNFKKLSKLPSACADD